MPFLAPSDPDPPPGDGFGYWAGLPLRWLYQMGHNTLGILRVLDITRFRPLPHGLIPPDHPWVTGLNPATGRYIWHDNILFSSPRWPHAVGLPDDEQVVAKTGTFLANRVLQSVGDAETPTGPRRRMPHAINYIHGTSHYNSGILVFTDFPEAYSYFTDPRFRAEVYRFVRAERRELLVLFRQKEYEPRAFAHFSCCLRTVFPWFANANGPKGRVLWGNAAPYPTVNIITGRWADAVYDLKKPGGTARIARLPIPAGQYFRGEYGGRRTHPTWPEKLLARMSYWRVRARGAKGGMYFVDRRRVFADQIDRRRKLGQADEPTARW